MITVAFRQMLQDHLTWTKTSNVRSAYHSQNVSSSDVVLATVIQQGYLSAQKLPTNFH